MIASILFGVLLAAVGGWFMVTGTPLQRRGARTTGRVVALRAVTSARSWSPSHGRGAVIDRRG
jgi:hypothetical protein